MSRAGTTASTRPGHAARPETGSAASAGLHPRQDQAGQRDRNRLSKQGCPALRRARSLAALTAVRGDPAMARWHRRWHRRWLGRGHAARCATRAVAHTVRRQVMAKIKALRRDHPLILPAAA